MRRALLTCSLSSALALAQAPAPHPPERPPAAPVQTPAPEHELADNEPSEHSSVSLSRRGKDGKQRRITVERSGDSDDTGIFAICSPRDDDPPTTPTLFVTSESGAGGIIITVDKNLIRAPLAVISKKAGEGEGGDGHIEMSAGSARYLDDVPKGKTDRLSLCAVEATPAPTPDTVLVTQGRTRLKGSALVYDESDGIARIAGPISFERDPAPGKPPSDRLSGSSQSIEVNVDQETTTLVGDVVLRSGNRVSRAGRVEYDDNANVAILRGSAEQPAESVEGGDAVRALVIRYNLDTGRVVAQQVTGQFEDKDP